MSRFLFVKIFLKRLFFIFLVIDTLMIILGCVIYFYDFGKENEIDKRQYLKYVLLSFSVFGLFSAIWLYKIGYEIRLSY